MQYATHIVSSPLSRCLDTACLALSEVTARLGNFSIKALPELQTLGGGPHGTGADVDTLRLKYGDGGYTDEATGEDVDFPWEKTLEIEDAEFEKSVDLRYMTKDWNEKSQVEVEPRGKWGFNNTNWREDYVRGFLRGLSANSKEGECVEVVVVGHASFFRLLIGEAATGKFKIPVWSNSRR